MAFVAGCTGDEEPAPTSSVTAPPTTEVPRQEYSYGFEVGQELEYRLDLERRIVIESEGTGQEGVVGDLPGQADAMVIASGLFTYTIGQGPQEGTYLVAIQGDYDRVEVTGTIDGETVEDPGQAAELLSLGPESTALVVDSAGHVLESVWGGAPEDSSTPGTSGGAAGFMGPILPPDPLGMGETWGETFTEMALGAAEVDGVLEGRLAGPGEDGEVIFENIKTTAAGDIDMAPLYRDFLTSTAEEGEEVQGLEELVFRIAVAPSETRTTGWFDPERGLPLRTTVESNSRTSTETRLPDPDTAEMQSFETSIAIEQTITYELLDRDST